MSLSKNHLKLVSLAWQGVFNTAQNLKGFLHPADEELKLFWILRETLPSIGMVLLIKRLVSMHHDGSLKLRLNTLVMLLYVTTKDRQWRHCLWQFPQCSSICWICFHWATTNRDEPQRSCHLIRSGKSHTSQPSMLREIRGSFKHSLANQKYA